VLDPAAEQIQHAKKQRERIYDDRIYFTSSKPPENAPEWTCNKEKIYDETDTEMLEYEMDDDDDNGFQSDEDYEQYDALAELDEDYEQYDALAELDEDYEQYEAPVELDENYEHYEAPAELDENYEQYEAPAELDENYEQYDAPESNLVDLTDPNLDFILNSAEMNSIRPEDLDEIGESSTSVS
jgi:hypothetical protein